MKKIVVHEYPNTYSITIVYVYKFIHEDEIDSSLFHYEGQDLGGWRAFVKCFLVKRNDITKSLKVHCNNIKYRKHSYSWFN